MAKNIVVLCDGTSNEIASDRTNVLRLFGALERSDRQIVFYDPGVGTFGAENSWSKGYRKAIEVWGLLTGWGLDQNVKEAYRFIVEHYDDGKGGKKDSATNSHSVDGDRDAIYIFGFSRGAYTARVLAGFIHAVGLINPQHLNLLDYAYQAYKRIGESANERAEGAGTTDHAFAEVRLYERILRTDRPPIRGLGLFDTVASIIEWGRFGPRLRSHAFTSTNQSVETIRHAVAIHEKRTLFRPKLWPAQGEYWGNPFNRSASRPQDATEVWFTGSHGDVGGGYPEADSALAKIPLDWMIREMRRTGLHFRSQTVNEIVLGKNEKKHYVKPDVGGTAHNSMNFAWAILEFLPRKIPSDGTDRTFRLFGFYIPLFEERPVPDGAKIHRSVADRADGNGEGLPTNIPADHDVVD